MPSLFRDDYVTNSNDCYWLSNPEQPLEGFARIIGDERTARSLRTRLGLKMVQQRLDGTDGRPGNASRASSSRTPSSTTASTPASCCATSSVALCKAEPVMLGTSGPVDVSAACPVLETWDLNDNLDDPRRRALPPLRREAPAAARAARRRCR